MPDSLQSALPILKHPTVRWISEPNISIPEDSLTEAVRIVTYAPHSVNATIDPSNELAQHLNHWDVLLELDDRQMVRLDPVPSPPSMVMTLLCTPGTREDFNKHGHVRDWEIRIQGILGLNELLELVRREGLDKYRFTPEGTGCRFWVWNFVDMLRRNGYVREEEQCQRALDGLRVVWDVDGNLAEQKWQINEHVKKGTFY